MDINRSRGTWRAFNSGPFLTQEPACPHSPAADAAPGRSKAKLEPRHECSVPRKLVVQSQWIEVVILAREIEHSHRQFGLAARRTVTSQSVNLPEFVPWPVRGVASITLQTPEPL